MTDVQLAYRMRTLFDQKITAFYFSSFKGEFGKVQIDVLSDLYEGAATTAVQLADRLNVPKQHISKILKRLETEGLLESAPAPDRRSRTLRLSEKGRALVEEHIRQSNEHFARVTAGLSPEDREELRRSMGSIAAIMERLE